MSRIMKARKVLEHVVLVQETIGQIKSRFTLKIPDIKNVSTSYSKRCISSAWMGSVSVFLPPIVSEN